MTNTTNTKDYFFKLLIPLFFIFNAVVYLVGLPEMTRILLAGAIGIAGFIFSYNIISSNNKIAFFFLLMIFSAFFTSIFNQNISAGNLIATIFYMGMAFILLEFSIDHNLSTIFFYGLSAFFFLQILIGNPPDNILNHVSRNYISVLMITSVSLVYISDFQRGDDVTLLPAIITFIISYWALGRGGIISAGILLVGVLFLRFRGLFKKVDKTNLIIGAVIAGIALLLVANATGGLNFVTKYFTAFSGRGLNTPRFMIYSDYLQSANESFLGVLFGPRIEEIRSIMRHDGNSHNSFIQMHAYFGLIFSGVVMVLLANSMLFFIRQRNYIFALLFFVLLTRAFTDRLFFSGYAEPLLYYFLFYPLITKKEKKRNRRLRATA